MTQDQKELLSVYAKKVVDKKLSVLVIFSLESVKYLAFIGTQLLAFFGPILTLFATEKKYYDFIELMEKRENIEYFLCKIETYEKNAKSLNAKMYL